jgi:hypothetical protein
MATSVLSPMLPISRCPDATGRGMDAEAKPTNLEMASPARLELATPGLGNQCSIRLSYGDFISLAVLAHRGRRITLFLTAAV